MLNLKQALQFSSSEIVMLSCVAEMSEVEDDKSEILDVVAGEQEVELVCLLY